MHIMKVLFFLLPVVLALVAVATPGSFNDLGEYKKVADDYWNTSNRVEVVIDVSSSSSSDVSSAVLQDWDFSSVINVWSTPFSGLLLLFR